MLDALAPLGVTDIAMPATPERVWQAINSVKACGGIREDDTMYDFDYQRPASLADAAKALGAGADAKLVAGGRPCSRP